MRLQALLTASKHGTDAGELLLEYLLMRRPRKRVAGIVFCLRL